MADHPSGAGHLQPFGHDLAVDVAVDAHGHAAQTAGDPAAPADRRTLEVQVGATHFCETRTTDEAPPEPDPPVAAETRPSARAPGAED